MKGMETEHARAGMEREENNKNIYVALKKRGRQKHSVYEHRDSAKYKTMSQI